VATPDEHLAQASRNEALAAVLAAAGYFDWAITALFYAALHHVQSIMIRDGVRVATHAGRDRLMIQHSGLSLVAERYRDLRVFSETARYDMRRYTQYEYQIVRDQYFRPVAERVAALTADTQKGQPDLSEPAPSDEEQTSNG
jgi:hypothetical protein